MKLACNGALARRGQAVAISGCNRNRNCFEASRYRLMTYYQIAESDDGCPKHSDEGVDFDV